MGPRTAPGSADHFRSRRRAARGRSEAHAHEPLGGGWSPLSMGKMARVADSDSAGVRPRREAVTRACEYFPRRVAHHGGAVGGGGGAEMASPGGWARAEGLSGSGSAASEAEALSPAPFCCAPSVPQSHALRSLQLVAIRNGSGACCGPQRHLGAAILGAGPFPGTRALPRPRGQRAAVRPRRGKWPRGGSGSRAGGPVTPTDEESPLPHSPEINRVARVSGTPGVLGEWFCFLTTLPRERENLGL